MAGGGQWLRRGEGGIEWGGGLLLIIGTFWGSSFVNKGYFL